MNVINLSKKTIVTDKQKITKLLSGKVTDIMFTWIFQHYNSAKVPDLALVGKMQIHLIHTHQDKLIAKINTWQTQELLSLVP